MNTQELTAAVAARTGLTRTAAENAVDAVLELIATEVSDGEKVTLPRFGVFEPLAPRRPCRPRSTHRRADHDRGTLGAGVSAVEHVPGADERAFLTAAGAHSAWIRSLHTVVAPAAQALSNWLIFSDRRH